MHWLENKNIYILMAVGILMVVLNKPVGKWFRQARLALGGPDYGIWSYRGPLIGIGLLLMFIGGVGFIVD